MISDESNESECVEGMRRGCDASDLPMLKLGINGVPVECLVDSGASCNVVSEATVQDFAEDVTNRQTVLSIWCEHPIGCQRCIFSIAKP